MMKPTLLILLTAVACGGSSPSPTAPLENPARSSAFPTRAELRELAEKDVGRRPLEANEVVVETWEFVNAATAEVGVVPAELTTPWELALEKQAATANVAASAAMQCVAREIGQFHLDHGALPSRDLRRFVASWCGSASSELSVRTLSSDVAADATEQQLVEAWSESVDKMLAESVKGANREAGIWFGQKDGHAALLLVVGTARVKLSQVARVPDEYGRITLEGELLAPAGSVRALVNKGKFGVARCARDPFIILPRFRVLCAPDPSDAVSRIEIAAFPPGRVLGSTVMDVVIWPAGEAPSRYERSRYGDPLPVKPKDEVEQIILEIVNGIRSSAGLEPLEFATKQSDLASKLAPHYFTAQLGYSDPLLADKIALGMMGGWDVGVRLRRGWFSSRLVSGTDDVSALLSSMVASPFGREVLLNPEARHLAVGAVVQPVGKILGAMVSTYAELGDIDREEAAAAAQRRLTEQRSMSSLKPPGRLVQALEIIEKAGAKVHDSGRNPNSALSDAIAEAAAQLGVGVKGWVIRGTAMEELEFPRELLEMDDVVVAMSVAVHQPEGEPWAGFVVLVLAAEPTERLDQIKLPGSP